MPLQHPHATTSTQQYHRQCPAAHPHPLQYPPRSSLTQQPPCRPPCHTRKQHSPDNTPMSDPFAESPCSTHMQQHFAGPAATLRSSLTPICVQSPTQGTPMQHVPPPLPANTAPPLQQPHLAISVQIPVQRPHAGPPPSPLHWSNPPAAASPSNLCAKPPYSAPRQLPPAPHTAPACSSLIQQSPRRAHTAPPCSSTPGPSCRRPVVWQSESTSIRHNYKSLAKTVPCLFCPDQ